MDVTSRVQRKVSLWRIANHEFVRALRKLSPDLTRTEILKALLVERSKAQRSFVKGLGISLVGVLWIENKASGGQIEVSLWSLQFSLPVLYLQFFLAFISSASQINAFNYMCLNEYTRIVSNRLFGFDNSSAIAIPFSGESAWSIGAMLQFRFFKSSTSHKILMYFTLLFALIPILIVMLYVLWVLSYGVIAAMLRTPCSSTSLVLSVVSIFVMLYPLVWIVTQPMKFKFEKNATYIRWNFLWRLYRNSQPFPAHVNNWLNSRG